ncbi:MAG: fibro-slime domain-containing protein [Clostridia bacterium]|nr:fibro-slime domain-containing protein [Clostridia bacterium]
MCDFNTGKSRRRTASLRGLLAMLLAVILLFSSDLPLLSAVSFAEAITLEDETNGTDGDAVDDSAHFNKTVISAHGETYRVTVTYGASAGIPDGSDLAVDEILPGKRSDGYDSYLSMTREALGLDEDGEEYVRLFDIRIVDATGEKVQIAAPVDVKIELADDEDAPAPTDNVQVVHFSEEDDRIDILSSVDIDTEEQSVSFTAEGFSAYAIVMGPETAIAGYQKLSTLAAFSAAAADGIFVGQTKGYYMTNRTYNVNSSRTGIVKTKPAASLPPAAAVRYYFELEPGETNKYKAYCYDGATKKYVVQTTNSLNFTTDPSSATVFTVAAGTKAGEFTITGSNGYCWNMQGGENGQGFAAWTGATDTNAQLNFFSYSPLTNELDGLSYGLMSWTGGAAGKGLMTTSSAAGTLDAKAMTVLSTADGSNQLFEPSDSDIPDWTFHWITEDRYYITTEVNGVTQYLKVDSNGVSLVSTPDQNCEIQVLAGSGIHAGEVCMRSNAGTLTYSGTVEGGFGVTGTVGSEWIRLVEESELTSDYFMTYSASKVSVSDAAVTNGSRIIVYTRSWNDTTKRYDFYAISSDGTLVPVYESGDSIEWVGGQINTLLWNFVEYYWEGTDDPNNYYELYNQYSEKFIAPQITDGQILSDDTIGINLNGRADGKYYSTILAWDDTNYSYAGLKVENGRIVSCPKSEAMDFYFAVMQDLNVDDSLTTVETLDNNQYGLTMKMVDIKTRDEMSTYLGNDTGGMGQILVQGLLSTNLGADGYPVADGGSLAQLYQGEATVNHLFIDSIYRSSGYFEFNSTQNFASLNNGNNFTVYKELGSYDSGGSKNTLKHGQFYPYNDLVPGVFTSVNSKNLYSLWEELPETDPRKYEHLYNLEHGTEKVNTQFAMELEASFTQTPSGLDAWGHDVIFEFTGDDDFWLYVDGELVLDLGGIHSSVPGDVNFRTGVVHVNGTQTTLRDLFYSNYITRGYTAAEAEEMIEERFEQNSDGQWVFKDYTNHTMRVFYMERGASASNLHMRFNLSSARKGTVLLTKQLDGVDTEESILVQFPYQIYYKLSDDPDAPEYLLTNALPNNPLQQENYVVYNGTETPVTYKPSVTIDGTVYNHVFLLKPNDVCEVSFPEGVTTYRIVEVGVNTDIYDGVSVNGDALTGTPVGLTGNREDYGIDHATTDDRSRVNYLNEVNPDALRKITIRKELYREDGVTRINYPDDLTTFDFRLYLATEFETLDTAGMQTYHVKDPDGCYCRWDASQQKFVKIGAGITDFEDLTAAEKQQATFNTSIYGSISRIPIDHTVEIRDILIGTQFKVQERPWEIPDGYSFMEYVYNGAVSANDAATGISDTVAAATDPEVVVRNLRGWGLRMNKVWSDADFMDDRDPVYFAVYINDGNGSLTPVSDTLRRLDYGANPQTLYWYFRHLQANTAFSQYEIREVEITAGTPVINTDGEVTNEAQLTFAPLDGGDEIILGGTQKGDSQSGTFTYNVLYDTGTTEANSNVRVDTVTNNRPGIVLKKAQWDGVTPLAGAVFTLVDNQNNLIGTFTSDADGLITVAFLRDGVPYTLTEVESPAGWYGLQAPITLTLNDGVISISTSVDASYYIVDNQTSTPTLTVKNKPYNFEVLKKDGDTNQPMSGVVFALHRQVNVDGVITIDLNPMAGYENLTTDQNGILPGLDNTLPDGVYELREKSTLNGYELLPSYIRLSLSPTGQLTLGAHPEGVTLTSQTDANGTVQYVLTILNSMRKRVKLLKVDAANTSTAVAGAEFDLYTVLLEDDGNGNNVPVRQTPALYTGLVSGSDGYLKDANNNTEFDLLPGIYHLVETHAPLGYYSLTDPIVITVTAAGVTYDDGTTYSTGGTGLSFDSAANVYTLRIRNTCGFEMPATGGPGVTLIYLFGGLLISAAGILLLKRRQKKDPGANAPAAP